MPTRDGDHFEAEEVEAVVHPGNIGRVAAKTVHDSEMTTSNFLSRASCIRRWMPSRFTMKAPDLAASE